MEIKRGRKMAVEAKSLDSEAVKREGKYSAEGCVD